MASQLRLLYAQYLERAKMHLYDFYTNKLKVREFNLRIIR